MFFLKKPSLVIQVYLFKPNKQIVKNRIDLDMPGPKEEIIKGNRLKNMLKLSQY